MELEEKIEELEGSLANLKVEIKGLLIELKELALRGQDPIRQNRPQAMVSAATPYWGARWQRILPPRRAPLTYVYVRIYSFRWLPHGIYRKLCAGAGCSGLGVPDLLKNRTLSITRKNLRRPTWHNRR